MTTNALSALEPIGSRTLARAQEHVYEFDLPAPGIVGVRNVGYDDDEDEEPGNHAYVVNVVDSVPTACSCPAFEYRDGACKHMVAVVLREPVLEAASDWDRVEAEPEPDPDPEPMVATDGGQVLEAHTRDESAEDGRPDGCKCVAGDALPCFACWLAGVDEVRE